MMTCGGHNIHFNDNIAYIKTYDEAGDISPNKIGDSKGIMGY
jgi:hypothetical protein